MMKFIAPLQAVFKRPVRLAAKRLKPYTKRWVTVTSSPLFAKGYAVCAALFLLATTLLWSILGARLNQQNADQLVNPLLLEKPETFREAMVPGSHSFLLKWPLFYLIKTLSFTPSAYVWVTVAIVLLTVGGLAYVLYRIDRRPVVFGTLLVALSSVLLLVPPTAYPGALLPVNMAMLATRNLEYLVYILGLYLLVSSRRVRSRNFGLAVVLLAILMASDKLFVSLTIGGAAVALMVYGLARGWNLVSTSARWLLAALVSAAGGVALLWALRARQVTQLASEAGLGPYGLVQSAHDLALGSVYAVLHFFTNFGANPASQTMVLRDIPRDTVQHMSSLTALSYLLNFAVCIFFIYAAAQIVRHSLAHNKDAKLWLSHPAKLSIMLIWITVTTLAVFVVTKHYYAADARYLGIALFTFVICGATYLSRQHYAPSRLVGLGIFLALGSVLALPSVLGNYRESQAALSPYKSRNERIVAILTQHPVKTVVGDYWRVIPLKSLKTSQKVMSLQSCTAARNTLTSRAWERDAIKASFAYVLSLDGGPTDFPRCSLEQVISAYGRPNASVIVEGTIARPKEIVLFYDNGAHKSAPVAQLKQPSTVLPVELSELPGSSCKQPATMNIVAHEDDDLLFMNPDTMRSLQAGNCVRTVYLTAGDAGQGAFYWLGREQGSQAAYGKMIGYDGIWVQRVVRLTEDAYATIANPRGNSKVSLIYLHIPDGGTRGQGFGPRQSESLAALLSGKKAAIHDVYNGTAYSSPKLQSVLLELMQAYQPAEIRTLSQVTTATYPDHSDHMAVSELTKKVYQQYEAEHYAGRVTIPIAFYMGYPVHALAANVNPADTAAKEEIFSLYARFDGSVCRSINECRRDPAYGFYLPRQYQSSY